MTDLSVAPVPVAARRLSGVRPSILIVDDTAANLVLISGMLRDRGYEPRPVLSGRLALVAARAEPPDLILLDVLMPEMSGWDVCVELKADPALQDIPVIFITALGETTEKVRAFALGAVDYVTKPFQVEEVCARVATHLELRRQKIALRQANDEFRELEKLRDNLVHMIVHDLRSPLTIIFSGLELAKMDLLPPVAAECVGEALKSTRMLIEMVSTLLDVSKLEARQMTLELSTVDLPTLIGELFQEFKPLLGRRRISLTASGAVTSLVGDASLLRRVIQNLIGNALKFTDKDDGIIEISVTFAAEGRLRVAVGDNGPGIPAEYGKKVFEKFGQVAGHKQGQARSSGLGLTFCKLAVEAHGGQIGLESAVGKGSTFWFELPRSQTASAIASLPCSGNAPSMLQFPNALPR